MKQARNYALLAVCLSLTTGCSTFRSYSNETQTLVSNLTQGQVDQALNQHESNASSDKDILYFLEKGELQRLKKLYPETIATWTEADKLVSQWESEAKITGSKVGEAVGSVVVNDKLRRYDGEDYEKVMLSTRLALAYLAAGKSEDALVEIKKTWERENLIKTQHEKDIAEAENEAKAKGYKTNIEDLSGYPIATLNNPDVTNLKNGYQNAFSHYLSGFLYEAAGELALASASYRTAIELQPNSTLLKAGLADLESRLAAPTGSSLMAKTAEVEQPVVISKATAKKSKKKTSSKSKTKATKQVVAVSKPVVQTSPFIPVSTDSDVLFVVETGVAPYKKSILIPLPVPYAGIVPISFPILESNPISANKATAITLPSSATMSLTPIASIENLSRRSLKDNLPWIMVRAAIRAAVKGGAQAAVYNQNLIAGLAVNALNVATEQADERTWGLLPSEIMIARAKLPQGQSTVKIQTSQGLKEVSVNVSGKYVVIPIRLIGNTIYNLQASL